MNKEELKFEYDILAIAREAFERTLVQMKATAYDQPEYPGIDEYIQRQKHYIGIINERLEPIRKAIIELEKEQI